MKKFLFIVAFFGLSLSTISLAQSLAPSIDADIELIEADSHDEADNRSCDIGILTSFQGAFDRRSLAQGLCSGFDDFCSIRQFGNQFYESSYRRRVTFRGRGDSHQSARRSAFSLYFDFLDKNRFYQNRFNHQFIFSGDCSS